MSFQIGMTYRHKESRRVFLAVSERELLNFNSGRPIIIAPYFHQRFAMCYHLTVDELLEHWSISEESLDAVATVALMRDFKRTQVKRNTKGLNLANQHELGVMIRTMKRSRR